MKERGVTMDKLKLKAKLVEKEKTYKDCAKALGISVSSFANKANEKSKFTVPEAKALSVFLEMTNDETMTILF